MQLAKINNVNTIDPVIADTYKILCEWPNKKDLYNKIANYYQTESTSGGKFRFGQYLSFMLGGQFYSKLDRAINVRSKIISPYNIYGSRIEYECLVDEIDIDFSEKDFHWL